jgi:iron-sulfur cluster assembly protein
MDAVPAAPSVRLTPAAAGQVRQQLAQRGHGLGLRLGVKAAGCSGFAYQVEFAEAVGADDLVFDSEGVRVVVAREHLALLAGVEVDFVRQGLNQSFKFRNPNASGECGCGESFTV